MIDSKLTEHLIIFTRYPEPGKTKTRLIPALGAEGAAMLQRKMTEHTLFQAKESLAGSSSLEIRFTGGNVELMQDWLGSDIAYENQGEGDLGSRLTRSLLNAIQTAARVVIIGTDCPGLSPQLIKTAFNQLRSYDLVLGPAIDGGYYLIGLSCFIPELFVGINWGTASVFQQTVDIAKKLNLSIVCLPSLADIDRPEDLRLWAENSTGLLKPRDNGDAIRLL